MNNFQSELTVLLPLIPGALASYAGLALLIVVFVAWLRVRTSPAYDQKPDQIVERAPGHRTLGSPRDALPEARIDLDFALLSQVAYEETPHAAKQTLQTRQSWLQADAELGKRGWSRWPEFGEDVQLPEKLQAAHLRVQVWINKAQNAVAVTFGGTVVNNDKDWISNARWFIFVPFRDDEYTQTVKVFAPAFAKEFVDKIKAQMPDPAHVTLFSTGHSLGGGLAQQFAYALPLRPDVPRVHKVFAFDSSPVTGYFSVDRKVRKTNRMGLLIDRIYERGEALAYVRSITNFIHLPSRINAAIRQIRYNLFFTVNPIKGHSIPELALKLWDLVHLPPKPEAERAWRRPKMW